MSPRLSVVVPFYGVEDYIGPCLESLAAQTFRDLEVILVDDGSPDGSAAIAQGFVDRDPRFRLLAQPNQGLGCARNTGAMVAEGEFITFVDSDDLVPWHAYEQMVGTLDSTGSSLVAANARRFNRAGGVRGSWLHRSVFQRTALATHITETPQLALDRMIWNKVYRRDFWEQHSFAFPPIRYEDYPVTLGAHLAALTVDMIATPLYYWRERESGDSITQQAFRYDNLLDRVRSAEMVFEVVGRAPEEIRNRTHAHLAEIDLTALVQAFGSVPDEDVERMLELGHRFADRLEPAALARRPRFDRVQYAALRAGDVALLRELADYRASGQMTAARIRRRPSRPWILENDFPGRGRETVPRGTFRMPRSSIQLTSQVRDVQWTDTEIVVRGTAQLRHLDAGEQDHLGLTLIAAGRRIPVPITHREIVDGPDGRSHIEFEARVSVAELADLPWVCWPVVFQIYVRHGYIRRKLPLRGLGGGSPQWPGGTWLTPDTWIQTATRSDGALQITQTVHPVVIDTVTAADDGFVLEGRSFTDFDEATLDIVRKEPFEPTRLPLEVDRGPNGISIRARLPLDELRSGETPEDPYTLENTWPLRVQTVEGTLNVLWTADYASVDLVRDGTVYSVTSTAGKYLTAARSPSRVVADVVDLSTTSVVVSGRWWPPARPERVSWRRYLPNSDDAIDVWCDLEITEDGWCARVELVELAAAFDPAGGAEPDWSLTVHAPDGDDAVRCSPRAGTHLPQSVGWPHGDSPRRWSVEMVRDTIHLVTL